MTAASNETGTSTEGPATLSIDIGGSGLKASVLDPKGAMLVDRVRVPTPFPLPPERLVDALRTLVEPLPRYDRISIGFPGMVRAGKVLTAPNLLGHEGPGSEESPELREAWTEFDLASALATALGAPTRVVNDADMQGGAVVEGRGVELVVTLGTGFGTALFSDGRICPHMELAHHPFRNGKTYEEELGDAARKRLGAKKWSRRVRLAVETLDALLFFDHLYVGGGNTKHLTVDLGPKTSVVENRAGILGGVRLWQD